MLINRQMNGGMSAVFMSEGSTRSSTVAHHVGTGEPCLPMEEQRD